LEFGLDFFLSAKKSDGFPYGHVQNAGDAQASITNVEYFFAVSSSAAPGARDTHVRKELHVDFERPVALAFLAPPVLRIETEMTDSVVASLRVGRFGEELSNCVKRLDVSHWIGSRRLADWALIDGHDIVHLSAALNVAIGKRLFGVFPQAATECAIQRALYE
jgi:hypothetical protein